MRETGKVIELTDGYATISLKRTTACGSCRACTIGDDPGEMRVSVKNDCGANVGDKVEIELRSGAFVSAAMILYGIPLAAMLFGFIAGDTVCGMLGFGEARSTVAFVSGMVMLTAVYALIKKLEPVWKKRGYAPSAAKVVEEEE